MVIVIFINEKRDFGSNQRRTVIGCEGADVGAAMVVVGDIRLQQTLLLTSTCH